MPLVHQLTTPTVRFLSFLIGCIFGGEHLFFFLESASEKSLDLFQQNFCSASVSVDVRAAVNILGLICQIVPLEVLHGSESKSTERTGKHEGGG